MQPHSKTAPGPLHKPHSSITPTHGSTSSQIPSSSASTSHSPPHSPIYQADSRRNRNRPQESQNTRNQNGARAVADAAFVDLAYTGVFGIADSIVIDIREASTTARQASSTLPSQSHVPSSMYSHKNGLAVHANPSS